MVVMERKGAYTMRFFSVDSPLYRFLCRLWDIIQINFFWLICSLPIVTMGASTAAAFKVCLHMADEEEGYIYKEFFQGFKENWKQGTVLEIITLVCAYAVYLDTQFFNGLEGNPVGFLILAIASGFLFFFCLIYTFPLIARYRNTLLGTIKNSLTISRKYFGKTLVMLAIIVLEIILWMFNKTTLFIGILIGPACIIYTIAGMALGIFHEIEKQPGSVTAEPESERE